MMEVVIGGDKMEVKKFRVLPCARKEIQEFVESHHYSKSINGVKTQYCFKMTYENTIVGAVIFAKFGMANVWRKYSDDESKVLELRRLCCIDEAPKNSESYLIGKCIRWLKNNTLVEHIITYADMDYNHEGVIYKATNFNYLGTTSKGVRIKYGDKLYHDKTIRTYYKGKLKPYALRIKNALENGDACYIEAKGKHIYYYHLKRKRNHTIDKIWNNSTEWIME